MGAVPYSKESRSEWLYREGPLPLLSPSRQANFCTGMVGRGEVRLLWCWGPFCSYGCSDYLSGLSADPPQEYFFYRLQNTYNSLVPLRGQLTWSTSYLLSLGVRGFVQITFLSFFSFLFFFLPHHMACRILLPWPGIKPMPHAVEAWSLNHWTTREVSNFSVVC